MGPKGNANACGSMDFKITHTQSRNTYCTQYLLFKYFLSLLKAFYLLTDILKLIHYHLIRKICDSDLPILANEST